MNKLYLTLLLFVSAISLHAQHQKLDMPYTTGVQVTSKFQPKSIQFGSNLPQSNDGLRTITTADGKAIMIKGTPTTLGRSGNSPTAKSRDFLHSAGPLMGIDNADEEFLLVNEKIDDLNIHHLKYQQVYNDIPVYGAEVILHGSDGNIDLMMGRYEATPQIDTDPTLDISDAESAVIASIGEIVMPDNDIYDLFQVDPLTTELVIYKGQLAYHTTAYSNLVDRREVFVDAHTGEIINEYKSFCKFHNHTSSDKGHKCNHNHTGTSAKSHNTSIAAPMGDEITNAIDLLGISRTIHTYEQGGTYYMMDISKPDMFDVNSNLPNEPEGVIWTINAFNTSPEGNDFQYDHFTSVNNTWANSPEAVSSQFNGNLAYEYFLDRHARVSINGQAGNIVSFVNVSDKQGGDMDNAFWNGFAMFYGNGSDAFKPLARGLDVAGHEMTHGVVQNTANLEYYGESGALNESFADVFGAMIDRDDWLVGEDVVNLSAFPSGALRSLIDPNQGQPTNSFGTGWQPKHVNQQFTGQEDNNGVHINSGIPNHAFYRFADAIGKDKAEDVYYRALDSYLTKSSQFIDARLAVIQSAQDLGLSASEVQAARDAFDAVGITDGNSTTTTTDIEENPGEDIIVYATEDLQSLSFMRPDGTVIAEGIAPVGIRSKITVTDNGSAIVFVNADNQVHLVLPDWNVTPPTFQQGTVNMTDSQGQNQNQNIRSVAVSRQGNRLAYTRLNLTNEIEVFDFATAGNFAYELYNPTFSNGGENTFDVAFADALEFDYSSDFIMYDALNQIQGLSGVIEYYDIGFLNVWNSEANSPALGNINKLFSGLPDKVSIGNPTFSKNSEYIIAFDYAEDIGTNGDTQYDNFRIYGANIETGDNAIITNNNTFGIPSYSTLDNAIVYTKVFEDNNPNTNFYDVGGFNLDGTKINPSGDEVIVKEAGRFSTWFSNGERDLVEVLETPDGKSVEMTIAPNPASVEAVLSFSGNFQGEAIYTITDITGKTISTQKTYIHAGDQSIVLPIAQLASGLYNVTLNVGDQSATTRFVKQ